MKITIDNKEIEIFESDKNLIDVADRNEIAIPAPCYRTETRNGCCMGCAVEIDGELKYACCTKPEEGMKIIVERKDLKFIRKMNIKAYTDMLRKETLQKGCSCGCSSTDSGCC